MPKAVSGNGKGLRFVPAKTATSEHLQQSQLRLMIAAARDGSNEAFDELSKAYWDYLLLLSKFGLDADMRAKVGASDVVQETLLDAYRGIHGFRGSTEAEFARWLRKILKNRLAAVRRRFLKTEKRCLANEVARASDSGTAAVQSHSLCDSQTPSRNAVANEDQVLLQQALAQLPEQYRRVLVLRNLEARSFEEIGRETGRTADAARMLWSRAMKHLQRTATSPHVLRPR